MIHRVTQERVQQKFRIYKAAMKLWFSLSDP